MNIEFYKKQFDSLFANPSEPIEHYSKRGYWVAKETFDNAIMFVGLNPSYPHEDYDESKRMFYDISKQKHPYFKQIREFHKKIVDN